MTENEEFHPVANIFPMMDDAALAELAADIAANGLNEPIWRHRDGRILDGRNRWLACAKAGVTCHAHTYEKDDSTLVAFSRSQNQYRRHMTQAQSAMVAGEIANLSTGYNRYTAKDGVPRGTPSFSAAAAGKMMGVGERTVKRARGLMRAAIPELVLAVKRGEIDLRPAEDIARLPAEEQLPALTGALEKKAAAAEKKASRPPRNRPVKPPVVGKSKGNGAKPGKATSPPSGMSTHDDLSDLPEQVCLQVNQLKAVADKIDPARLHELCTAQHYNNLEAALPNVLKFLSALHEQHLAHGTERKNAAMQARRLTQTQKVH